MTTQENLEKVLAGLDAVNQRDIQSFIALLSPDFKLYLIVKPERLLPQGRISGADGFATYLSMLYTAFSDVVFEQIRQARLRHRCGVRGIAQFGLQCGVLD